MKFWLKSDNQTLDMIDAYERDTYDKLDPEELKKEQRERKENDYSDELMTNVSLTIGETKKEMRKEQKDS